MVIKLQGPIEEVRFGHLSLRAVMHTCPTFHLLAPLGLGGIAETRIASHQMQQPKGVRQRVMEAGKVRAYVEMKRL